MQMYACATLYVCVCMRITNKIHQTMTEKKKKRRTRKRSNKQHTNPKTIKHQLHFHRF